MDLEVGTNSDDKARFDGLPDKAKRAPYFEASEGSRTGSAFYNPHKNCQAEHAIMVLKNP